MTLTSWPPDYQIRKSSKARRAGMRITRGGDLEVVIPVRMRSFNVQHFLTQHKDWVLKHMNRLATLLQENPLQNGLPDELPLLSINTNWKLVQQPSSLPNVRLKAGENSQLILSGNISNIPSCRMQIKKWLRLEAKRILTPWFANIAEQSKLSYQNLRINFAKTRWGSCSVHGNINLNAKLILLPSHLVEYVMLHELSHTVHLNHSAKFWRLLASLDVAAEQHRKELLQYRTALIQWLEK